MSTSRPRPRFDPTINYYQVLDVPLGASRDEITRAYRALMRLTHPDNFVEPGQRAKAEERTKLINAAYTVLSKPEIRREYDAQMRTTVMSDVLMQRYTGNAPGRSGPVRPRTRRPSTQTIRAQRKASNSAIIQLLLVTAAFVAGVAVLFGSVYLAWAILSWQI